MKKYEIERKALEVRNKIGMFGFFHEAILRNKLEENGYFLFYYPFGKQNFSGASYKQGNVKVIIINSSYPLGRQNFTLAHELGHIELHKNMNIIDFNDLSREKEREADVFASCFIIPRHEILSIKLFPDDSKWTVFNVMMLSQKFRVSYEAAFHRAQEIFGKNMVPETLKNIHVGKTAKVFGLSIDLYKPTKEHYMSENLYIERILKAYATGKISMGKFLSLAHDIGIDGYDILDKIREEKNVRDR